MTDLTALLHKATNVHYLHTGETVTKLAVAAILFPSRQPKTQMQNLNNLLNGHTRIMGEHIKQLVDIFPDTTADY